MFYRCGFVAIACLTVSLISGCSGGAPTGFPKVIPCQITVLEGTTPIADVEVMLHLSTPMAGTIFFGKTNASGVSEMGTSFANYHKSGVPEGSYKVVLFKEPDVENTKTQEERSAMSRPAMETYRKQMQKKRDALPRIIPVPLTKSATTPLTLDVSGRRATLTVNVAEFK